MLLPLVNPTIHCSGQSLNSHWEWTENAHSSPGQLYLVFSFCILCTCIIFFFFKRMLGFLNHNILKCYQMLYAFQFKFSSEHTVIFHFCGGPVCMCSWLFLPSLLQSGRQRKKAVMMPRVVLTPLKVNGEHVPSGYNSSFSCSLFSPPSPFLYFPPTLQWFVYLLPLTMDALYLSGLTVFVILHIDTL